MKVFIFSNKWTRISSNGNFYSYVEEELEVFQEIP